MLPRLSERVLLLVECDASEEGAVLAGFFDGTGACTGGGTPCFQWDSTPQYAGNPAGGGVQFVHSASRQTDWVG